MASHLRWPGAGGALPGPVAEALTGPGAPFEIAVDHPELGQEPKAFVVPRPGAALTADGVRTWCAAALAPFKVPVAVEFRDSLPYSPTGKLLKQQLES